MNTALEKLLLSELRVVVYKKNDSAELTDEGLLEAMTANEELRALGYTLKPQDIAALAMSPSLTGFPGHFRELIPDVPASPMYPDFPKQVMEISEAEFRLHQMIHYFSTYGLEELLGTEVSRGWLPNVKATEKTEKDEILLEAKALELMPEEEAPLYALCRVLGRRERLTMPGRELIALAIPLLEPEDIAGLRVPFKENLTCLFDAILEMAPAPKKIDFWRQICQHTGDVLKSVNGILPLHKYHFTTSRKKALVKLLESYPVKDFQANLILSRGKREKNLTVLQFLDYNMYSASAAHKEAVRALRNGELRSWEAQVNYLLSTGDDGALDYIAARPGMMLRMLSRLLRMGYPEDALEEKLMEKAGSLSLHTIVNVMNALDFKMICAPSPAVYERQRNSVLNQYRSSRTLLVTKYSKPQIKILYQRKLANHERWYQRAVTAINKSSQYSWLERQKKLRVCRNQYEEVLHILKEAERIMLNSKNGKKALRNLDHKEQRALKKLDRDYQMERVGYYRAAPHIGSVQKILKDLLEAHLKNISTELSGKKVFLDMERFDLEKSNMEAGQKSDEGGYLPGGIAIRIPEEVKHLRFFVYWNDKSRVDVDLHAYAHNLDEKPVHVGWNADFNNSGIIHSGDITESDAAEYIDIDMDAPLTDAEVNISIYSGKPSFKEIQTCYVGMMAVKNLDETIELYSPANCFFTHELRSGNNEICYGRIDIPARLLYFLGKVKTPVSIFADPGISSLENTRFLSMKEYLLTLLHAQNAEIVTDREAADIILTIEKSADPKAVCLTDQNFYLDA